MIECTIGFLIGSITSSIVWIISAYRFLYKPSLEMAEKLDKRKTEAGIK